MSNPREENADCVRGANYPLNSKKLSRTLSNPKHPLILDGGLSRELIRLGAPFRQPEWSALALIEAPHFVRKAHSEFAAAGADILTTNSYALVPYHIGQERFEQHGRTLAALAGQMAREAADEETRVTGREVLVAGSLPPIFGSYEPAKFDPSRVHEYLATLIQGLLPYVDVWLGETLSLIAEADAVRSAVRDSGRPFWISFTLEDGDGATDMPKLRSGEAVKDAAQWAIDAGAAALLFNCSRPEVMNTAIKIAKAECVAYQVSGWSGDIPIVGVYANAFVAKSEGQAANVGLSDTRTELSSAVYGEFTHEWLASGATIVGGCCGIGPDHIRHLANVYNKSS